MNTKSEHIPRVGVGVIIKKDGKILLGKRKGSHGEGTWSIPGGHLDFMEPVINCAKREAFEETGLKVTNARILTCTESFFNDLNLHYVNIAVAVDCLSGEPKVCEPEKCEVWGWFDWDNLPEPLFPPFATFVEQEINPFT